MCLASENDLAAIIYCTYVLVYWQAVCEWFNMEVCQEPDLNWWHKDFQSSALPTELSRRFLYSTLQGSSMNVKSSLKRIKDTTLLIFIIKVA